MRVTFEYDFSNIRYKEGKESIDVDIPNYKYNVDISEDEYNDSIIDLYNKYKEVALEYAVYREMIDYATFIL